MIHSLAYFVTILRKNFTDFCNLQLQEMGLSQGLLFFIIYVGKHPGCTPKELTEALRMDVGHSARTITKLVNGGFLNQTVNPKDHRSHILMLTAEGEKAFQTSYDLFAQWDEEVLEPFSQEEREQLMGLLYRLTNQVESIE